MRRLSFALAAAVAVSALAPVALAREAAPAPSAPATAPAAPAKDDPNRMICTREHVVGSNRAKKVCLTAAQRDELRDQARRNMDEGRRTPGGSEIAPTNTGA